MCEEDLLLMLTTLGTQPAHSTQMPTGDWPVRFGSSDPTKGVAVSDLGRWSEPKLYQPPRVIFNPFPHLFTVSPSFMSSSIFLSLCLVFFKEMILLLTVIPSEGDSVSFYSMCIRMSHIEILTPIQPLHNFSLKQDTLAHIFFFSMYVCS